VDDKYYCFPFPGQQHVRNAQRVNYLSGKNHVRN
jgi:hypothetical protein